MMPAAACPEPQPTLFRFGVFELDVRTCELRKRGQRIKLQEQPLQVLATLLERPGDVVTREELWNRLWPRNTFVDLDTALNKAISKIRETLDDSADSPRFVETLPRRGYRFIAPVERSGTLLAVVGTTSSASKATPNGQRRERSWRATAGAALAILAATGIFVASRRQPKLVSEDTIVLADFENKTGDPVFDDTLKQALAAGLHSSTWFPIRRSATR